MDFFEVLKNKASGTSEQDKTLSGVPPINIIGSNGEPLLEWSITGDTYQEWTPSPEPQVGNNKLDNSKIEKSSTITNFTYTDSSISFASMTVGSTINSAEIKSEDTSYAFSFSGGTSKVSFALKCYNSSHTYLGDANKIFDEENRAVMTLLSNTVYIRLVITSTVQGNVSLTNLMLNKGNTVMTFEPFKYLPNTGICYVQGVGDGPSNLFDKNSYIKDSYAYKFKCNLMMNNQYTIKNYSDKPIIVKISNHRDGYSSVEITCQPMESPTFVMTKHPNVPQGETQYIFLRVDGVWVTDISQLNGIDIMLNEGLEPLPYEPYGYKVPVVSRGKNLFDYAQYLNLVTDYEYAEQSYHCKSIRLKPNTQYALSFSRGYTSNAIILISQNRRVNTGGWLDLRKSDHSYACVTDESGNLYIGVAFSSDTEVNTILKDSNIMLNEGIEPLPYEPYIEPKTSEIYLNSPLMADEQLKSDRTKNVKWGEYVLTGYESYQKNDSDSSKSLYYTNINIPDLYATTVQAFCSHLVKNDDYGDGTFTFSPIYRVMYLNFGLAFMESIGGNSTQALTNYIKAQYNAGTPIIIYYTLINPKSETIDIPQIPTIKGNFVLDVGTKVQPKDMTVTYKMGYKNKAKTFDDDFYRLLFSSN